MRLFPLPPTGGPMQTTIWLHKPTNTRYYIGCSNGAAILMKGALKDRWATEAELNDSRIWSKV